MAEGLTTNLIWTAFWVGLACLLVAWRDLPLLWAVALTVLRIAVPLVYFAWYYDGQWNLLDDLSYFGQGNQVLDHGYNPFSVLFDPDGLNFLFTAAEGHHVLYQWWNALAVWLFGPHYYAPVFLNVLGTFISGWILLRTVKRLGFGDAYSKWLLVVFLLHWDTIVWSSLVNLKDSLVLLLTVGALHCAAAFFQEQRMRWLVGLIAISTLFYWIRFYVPVLMVLAGAAWMLTQWGSRWKYLLVPLGLFAMVMLLPESEDYAPLMNPETLVLGVARFTLTPLPWRLTPGYSFLAIPSVLHLAFFVPAVAGFWLLWRDSTFARLYLIYFIIVILMYSVTDELLGIRQRVQISFIFIWLQFHFLWHLRNFARLRPGQPRAQRSSNRSPAEPVFQPMHRPASLPNVVGSRPSRAAPEK